MKRRVAIVAGGMSSEHEISCISAGGVLSAIDRSKYEPILIGITKDGRFVIPDERQKLGIENGVLPEISSGREIHFAEAIRELKIDVVFPVLHGPYGEDGTFQGECEMAQIRYVGSGVLASAVAMDKSFAKPIFASHGLRVADGLTIHARDWSGSVDLGSLSFPVFVKPARGGSSKGTSKVKSSSELRSAIEAALEFDTKVMIEEAIVGREIECAVLQIGGVAHASPLGEIKIDSRFEFYDFEAKYLEGSTTVVTPAEIPSAATEAIQRAAVAAFSALGCEGLARVDFFYSEAGEIVINEINTMPGFTPSSVFPKLWAQGGKSYVEIISTLIESALARPISLMR